MSAAHDELRVNGARLRHSLEAMAEIGATPGGGMHRLTLSDDEVEETSWEDCEAGANVFLQCVLASADEPGEDAGGG